MTDRSPDPPESGPLTSGPLTSGPLTSGPLESGPQESGPSQPPEPGLSLAGFLGGPGAGPAGADPTCSARGCRQGAVWALRWNNPKLHTPERRKVWTACDDHRADLESFLRSRGFLRDTVAVDELEHP